MDQDLHFMSFEEIKPSEDDIVYVFEIIFESFEITSGFQEKIIGKLTSTSNTASEYKLTIYSKTDEAETVWMHDSTLATEKNIIPEIIISMRPERFRNLYNGLVTSKKAMMKMYKHNFYRFKFDYNL